MILWCVWPFLSPVCVLTLSSTVKTSVQSQVTWPSIPFHWPSLSRLVSRDIKTVRRASVFTPLTLVLHSGKNPQFRALALSLGGAFVLWWVSLICLPGQIYGMDTSKRNSCLMKCRSKINTTDINFPKFVLEILLSKENRKCLKLKIILLCKF